MANSHDFNEPVAWMYVNMDGECEQIEYLEDEPMPDDPFITPLYTTPQPRRWVGLTEEEIGEMMMQTWGCASIAPRHAPAFAQAIEAKLKEKNT